MAGGKWRKKREAKREIRKLRQRERQTTRKGDRRDKKDERAVRQRLRIAQRQSAKINRANKRAEAKIARAQSKEGRPSALETLSGLGSEFAGALSGGSFGDDPLGTFGDDPQGIFNQGGSDDDDFTRGVEGDLTEPIGEKDYRTGYYREDGQWVEFNALQKLMLSVGLIKPQY